MTSGNPFFDKKEAIEYIRKQPRLIRPANYPPNTPGNGYWVGQVNGAHVAVMNVMGRVFMPPSDRNTSANSPGSFVPRTIRRTLPVTAIGWARLTVHTWR